MDFSYSNTLGWNTFPVPTLTEQAKADLTRCAEDILLAREAHFPATIADLYDPEAMPDNLRAAHDRNDETLERIYIGRRFKNDTERLETLFAMYAKMTENQGTRDQGTGIRQKSKREEGTGMSTASIPSVSIAVGHTGRSKSTNELGMRAMQAEAYKYRGEQFLLIKSPPASGKSRSLMYIALDKLANQGVKQALIVVPERSIGASLSDEPLAAHGFWADWTVRPKWNLCAMPGGEETHSAATGKVKAVGEFLAGEDKALVCTHATFRFSVEALGIEAFDDRLIAIDEFHHVSVNEANVLGGQLKELLNRGKVHVVAMTGSYFRGDTAAVLSLEDEARFATVTYTYYEQLNGYEYLKALDLGHWFYSGSYLQAIGEVLDPKLKTIVHIPNVNSSASSTDKYAEVSEIMGVLGEWQGRDEMTDFHLVRERDTGRMLKVADLVDDSDSNRRRKVLGSLRDPAHRNDRDHVDVIIALEMAKEGFDWIWCEHALTVGYRSSLTEIVQIIGRVTRDAPGKTRAKFTNLIAEPLADQSDVVEAVNDTLKAIAASLLIEQVIAPRFDFTPCCQ